MPHGRRARLYKREKSCKNATHAVMLLKEKQYEKGRANVEDAHCSSVS